MNDTLNAAALRSVRECAGCCFLEAGAGPALCTWHPHIADGHDWPAMVRRVEENRAPRGLCGVIGRMWKEKHGSES